MATPTSNLLPITNPFASAPKAPANPFAKAPLTTVPPNTGVGTNGAPMSVVPSTLKTTPGLISTTIPKTQPVIQSNTAATVPTAPVVSPYGGLMPTGTGGGNPYALPTGVVPKTPEQIAQETGQTPQPNQGAGTGSTVNPSFSGFLGGLANIGGSTNPAITKAAQTTADIQKNIGQLRQAAGTGEGAYTTSGLMLPVAQGRAQALAQSEAQQEAGLGQQEQAAQQQVTNLLGAQGQQISALGTGAGLAQPVQQAGMLTNPQTGQPLNPSLVSSAITQAAQLVANGADVNSPQVQALITPFGYYGASGFTALEQAISGGGFNPSSQSAIVQQNLSQGQHYQQQSQDISNSLQLLGTVRPQLVDFMTRANLNPALAPIVNTQINKIDAQGNPEAYKTMQAVLGETKSFVQQMLQATGGMTPTDAGQVTDSYDFGTMTPKDLDLFLQNMELVGNYRLSQAQSASQSGYTAGGSAAQGVDANTSGQLKTAATGALNQLPPQFKFIMGAGSNLISGIGSSISGAASSVAGPVAGGALEQLILP